MAQGTESNHQAPIAVCEAPIIVGGGIAGLVTALTLAQHGLTSCVLEQASRFGPVGAGIQLAPNATRILDALELLTALEPSAQQPSRIVYRDALTGDDIAELPLGADITARYGHPYIALHRADLHSALVRACRESGRVRLLANKRAEAVTDLGDRVRVRCGDASEHEGDLLVAADGLHSTVRPLLIDDSPVLSGYVAYRGTIPADAVDPADRLADIVMWVGPGLHLVQYAVCNRTVYNQVAVFRSSLFAGREQDTAWGTPEELDERFAVCTPRVRRATRQVDRDRRWELADREPVREWTRNRIVLVGDAAHPMHQYVAQGACQAIEDADALAVELARADQLSQGLQAFVARRQPRATMVQSWARFFGEASHLTGVGGTLRTALFSRLTREDLLELVDRLYGTAADTSTTTTAARQLGSRDSAAA